MSNAIAITGLGCISALGPDVATNWEAQSTGVCGIKKLQGFEDTDVRVNTGAQISSYDSADHFSRSELALLDKHTQLAVIAASEAVADANLTPAMLKSAATIVGSGDGGRETDELNYTKLFRDNKTKLHPFAVPRGMFAASASQISMRLGTQGPSFVVSSACASSNHAIIQAALLIRAGIVDVAIVGGSDAPFNYGLLKAWEALRVLATDKCRPFSADRNGFVLAEGAGIVVLESMQHAQNRNANIYAELSGFGMTANAGHITDPSIDGAVRAMQLTLADAGVSPEQISYINAHGTGTKQNDPTETLAIREVFGKHADNLLVSSTKSMHGHALGASGAIEFITTVLSLRDGIIPPTINFTSPGEGCDLNYVPNTPVSLNYDMALSNSFAFGGLNAVLALRKTT